MKCRESCELQSFVLNKTKKISLIYKSVRVLNLKYFVVVVDDSILTQKPLIKIRLRLTYII